MKSRNLVAIERKGKLEKVHGFLLSKSKDWLLIEGEKEFQTDGYRVIARKDVKNIRYNAADKIHQEICKRLGVVPGPPPKVPYEKPEQLFLALRLKRELVIVECERAGEWPYSIGKIEGVAEAHVQIRYFNVEGRFEKTPRVIAYRHISQVGFAERYIKGYSVYFAWKKEKWLQE